MAEKEVRLVGVEDGEEEAERRGEEKANEICNVRGREEIPAGERHSIFSS